MAVFNVYSTKSSYFTFVISLIILTTEGLYWILKLYIKNLKSNLHAFVVVVFVSETFKNSFVYYVGEKINSYY